MYVSLSQWLQCDVFLAQIPVFKLCRLDLSYLFCERKLETANHIFANPHPIFAVQRDAGSARVALKANTDRRTSILIDGKGS
jgi:hypothetical protein